MNRRVLIVDDHPLLGIGMRMALEARGWDVEVADSVDREVALDHASRWKPVCVLLDLNLGTPVASGLDLVAPLTAGGSKVVMLTAEVRPSRLAACLEAGAVCWIGKDAFLDEVEATLEEVLAGRSPVGCSWREAMLANLRSERAEASRAQAVFDTLTDRERSVLRALMGGMSADEIADESCVALSTVRSQIRAILRKLGVRSQLAAVATAHRAGWSADDQQHPLQRSA